MSLQTEQPEPDFSYNMFDHGLTELFVGAGGAQGQGATLQGEDLQQVCTCAGKNRVNISPGCLFLPPP